MTKMIYKVTFQLSPTVNGLLYFLTEERMMQYICCLQKAYPQVILTMEEINLDTFLNEFDLIIQFTIV